MSRRVRFCIAFYTAALWSVAKVIRVIGGPDGMQDVITGFLKLQQKVVAQFPANMAQYGMAREGATMLENLDRLVGQLRPNSSWTFHKDQWGAYEVVVMPRVLDSNTGVVTGPPGSPELGSVVTNDHQPPNCDPPALQSILYGPPGSSQVDAEFVA